MKRSARFVLLFFMMIGLTGVMGAVPRTASPQKNLSHRRNIRTKTEAKEVRSDAAIHIVKPGDTLYELARAHRISVRELKEINHLRTNRLRLGQQLKLTPSMREVARRRSGHGKKMAARGVVTPSEDSKTDSSDDAEPTTPAGMTMLSDALPANAATATAGKSGEINLRSQLIQAGMDFLGVPYRWTGVSETRGVDCSGLVKTLFDRFNIDLPHSAREQFKLGEKVAKTELAIGDLVFFSTRGRIPTHVGIYIGDNQILHAASKAGQVIISNLGQSWYQKRFLGARRIEDLWKDDPKPMEAKGN